jgi:hypothetical protein
MIAHHRTGISARDPHLGSKSANGHCPPAKPETSQPLIVHLDEFASLKKGQRSRDGEKEIVYYSRPQSDPHHFLAILLNGEGYDTLIHVDKEFGTLSRSPAWEPTKGPVRRRSEPDP